MTSASKKKGIVAGRVVVAQAVAPAGVIDDVRTASHAASLAESLRRHEVAPRPEHEPAKSAEGAAQEAAARLATYHIAPAELDEVQTRLERRIRAHLSRGELVVTLTDNRYTMISVRRENKGKHFKVRLHYMFAEAGPVITRALARYIAHNDREASRVLGEYIDSNQHRVRTPARRAASPRMVTKGKHYDLQEIFDSINQEYFGGAIEARITWGQRTGKLRRRNSIKMGSYSVEEKLIRIHRSLDRQFVPRFFVEWVVYHEMLHQVHDIKVVNGRRLFHSREFLRDEAKFAQYAAARCWERVHLDALLTY